MINVIFRAWDCLDMDFIRLKHGTLIALMGLSLNFCKENRS